MAFEHRRRIVRISIIDNLARCQSSPQPPSFQPDTQITSKHRDWIESEVLCLFAGLVAEGRLRGRPVKAGSRQEMDSAVKLLSNLTRNPEETGAYADWLLVRTRYMLDVPRIWRAVEKIAQALLENGELSERFARQLWWEAWREKEPQKWAPVHERA
jgi:hypothetical protein